MKRQEWPPSYLRTPYQNLKTERNKPPQTSEQLGHMDRKCKKEDKIGNQHHHPPNFALIRNMKQSLLPFYINTNP